MKQQDGIGIRRAYDEDDDFFEDGNVLRYSKYIAQSSSSVLSSSSASSEKDLDMIIEDISKPLLRHTRNRIECNYPGCREVFYSIPNFTSHYNTHSAHCITCNAMLPNQRLLDIHISEAHSSYFLAQASRKPSYVCIVESCGDVFWTTEDRSQHMMFVHKFSSNYPFVARTCTKTQQKRAKKKDPSKFFCKFVKFGQFCPKGPKCKFIHTTLKNDEDQEMEYNTSATNPISKVQSKSKSNNKMQIGNMNENTSTILKDSVSSLLERFDQISFGQHASSYNTNSSSGTAVSTSKNLGARKKLHIKL